ncbi:MAG: SGNH/GDSL hydrolase family protein [Lentisphaerae bacterium]|nr:SGNH/GDSL hydrolase family protein [Lentisphaerota bacterium]
MTLIQDGATVLFQGDSVTDCGRSRENDMMLGGGYAAQIAARFTAAYPEKGVRFLNRGISGNRSKDLVARWQQDCIDLKPDWVSILIGINDTWRRYDREDPTSVEDYAANCREFLRLTRENTKARIILLEPFVLPYPEDRKAWRVDLDPKINALRLLALEFKAIYVPLDGIMAAAACRACPALWAADGVHPTQAGHALIARHWLKALGARA